MNRFFPCIAAFLLSMSVGSMHAVEPDAPRKWALIIAKSVALVFPVEFAVLESLNGRGEFWRSCKILSYGFHQRSAVLYAEPYYIIYFKNIRRPASLRGLLISKIVWKQTR